MAGGEAHGVNREYQEHCRDVIKRLFPDFGFEPYSGDGIDVPFDFVGSTWKLDVALRDRDGHIFVAECKRWIGRTTQGDMGLFAYRVNRLREALDVDIAGGFFSKSIPNIGMLKVGKYEGIDVAQLDEGTISDGFQIAFERYNAERDERLKHYTAGLATAKVSTTGQDMRLVYTDRNGKRHTR